MFALGVLSALAVAVGVGLIWLTIELLASEDTNVQGCFLAIMLIIGTVLIGIMHNLFHSAGVCIP